MVARSHHTTHVARLASALALLLGGCSIDGVAILAKLGPDDSQFGDEFGDGDESEGEGEDQGDELGVGDGNQPSLDLPEDEAQPFSEACFVNDGLDAAPPCDAQPPSNQLAPIVAWTWTGPSGEDSVLVTPLVANFDDDNLDAAIDLCDQPDLIVLAVNAPASKDDALPPGHIYVIDSVTGETKWRFEHDLDATATPAIADLDDDGIPELLAFEAGPADVDDEIERRVVAFEADGTLRWASDTWVGSRGGALAIADLDGDGSPEILAPEHVLTADGALLWAPPDPPTSDSLPIAADLDLDGDLEVLFGRSVYDHDGALLFELAIPGNKNAGLAAIANFDDDPEPEIYIHSGSHQIFEADGSHKVQCGGNSPKNGPATIIDINGDGKAEILANFGESFRAMSVTAVGPEVFCQPLWSVKVSDGVASAFDFLADGSAEAIYADLTWVRIFDQSGEAVAQFERSARPSLANPVVADADNDGAAELVIVSSEPLGGDSEISDRVSVMLVQNQDDRFAPTRRIWNQHAYYVTNVREDARVPSEATSLWLDGPNSFRSNPAPSYAGGQCQNPSFE